MRNRMLGLTLVLISAATASACLWDNDTIQQETAQFPGTLDLMIGRFPRHTREFYEWRIKDRTARLATEPMNADLYDDIAVSCDKLNRHAEAIAWMVKKETAFPGRYETVANLGTFYFHSGEFEKGIPHIEKALAINPDAHFGRERYQLWLVQYLLEQRKAGRTLPLAEENGGYARFVVKQLGLTVTILNTEQRQAAIAGIEGMMRFGKHDSPILLEALGDLLAQNYLQEDAKQLAARAYLLAEKRSDDMEVAAAYRAKAVRILEMHTRKEPLPPGKTMDEVVDAEFVDELRRGIEYDVNYSIGEADMLKRGGDPEVYYQQELQRPVPILHPANTDTNTASWLDRWMVWGVGLGTGMIVITVAGGLFWMSGRRGEA